MMKRIVSLTLAVLLIAALFAGCGSSSVEGTYKLRKINDKPVKDFVADLASTTGQSEKEVLEAWEVNSVEELENVMTITLKSDNTFELKSTMDGEEENGTGTWKQEGEKVILTVDGEEQEFTIKDGMLEWDLAGLMKFSLGK